MIFNSLNTDKLLHNVLEEVATTRPSVFRAPGFKVNKRFIAWFLLLFLLRDDVDLIQVARPSSNIFSSSTSEVASRK